MFTTDQITHSTTDDGRKVATISVDSSNLPAITVDTYQTFSGEGWAEGELGWMAEQGYRPDEVGVDYDMSAVLKELAEASNEIVGDQLRYADEIDGVQVVTVGEVTDTFSPAFYNFATDSYGADYTIDLAAMETWITERGWDHVDYGLEHFSSRDGFASHVPGWLEREDMAEGVRLWLFLHAYLAEVLDRDELFYGVAEAEYEAYSNNTTPRLEERAVSTRIAEVIAELTGLDVAEAEDHVPADLDGLGLAEGMAWDFDEYSAWVQAVGTTIGTALRSTIEPKGSLDEHLQNMAKLA